MKILDTFRKLSWQQKTFALALLLLVSLNITYFLTKKVQLIESNSMRLPSIATDFVCKNIPKGSKVVSPPLYGYAINDCGSEFRMIDPIGTYFEEGWRAKTGDYPFEYVIITDRYREARPQVIKHYFSTFSLQKVDEIHFKQSPLGVFFGRFLSNVEKNGYGATIYKHVK